MWRNEEVEQRAKVFSALADPTRLQLVEFLSDCDEMTGSELAERLGITLAMLCHHSKILVEAGVIHKRKEGQTTYSSLNRKAVKKCLASLA